MTTEQPIPARKRIIILGGLSAIAEQAARLWAEQTAHIVLAGRNRERLEAVAADLRLRGGDVETVATDLADAGVEQTFADMVAIFGGADVVLLAYGELGDQRRAETDMSEAQRLFLTNFTSAASWCLAAASVLEAQRHGTLIVIGSVAGDRGRASNYVYGAAKGGLGVLVQGIAHRLARSRARAVLIKPGFVDTPMTAAFRKGLFWAKPEVVAAVIVKAADGGLSVSYAPWFWRWIMYIIRFLPAFVMHRTRL